MDALREKMPKHRDTVCLYVFGSQARGDERPDSDLDVLHIVNRWCSKYSDTHYSVVRDIVRDTPGGVQDVTVLVETTLTIQKQGNLYGAAEYGALREGRVIYGEENAHMVHTYDMPAAEAARRWLSRAYMCILHGRQMEAAAGRFSGLDDMWARSVEFSLNSILCAGGVRFPFVRGDLRRLHGMLPDGEAVVDIGDGVAPGRRDAERAYGQVRELLGDGVQETFAIDDGLWDTSGILTGIADLELLRSVPADRLRSVLDERIGILRGRLELLTGIADGVVVGPAGRAAGGGCPPGPRGTARLL